jgi:hypothetical protein
MQAPVERKGERVMEEVEAVGNLPDMDQEGLREKPCQGGAPPLLHGAENHPQGSGLGDGNAERHGDFAAR